LAVANREISLIQNQGSKTPTARDKHVQLLEHFLTLLPHILPPEELSSPVLLHHDLHPDNIFVDDADPTKILSIIDWQVVYSAPLFMQARFPSIATTSIHGALFKLNYQKTSTPLTNGKKSWLETNLPGFD
jgi:hypothetical protein